jgi:uncharacterized membrane protein
MKLILGAILLSAIAISVIFYPRLPQEMPTHWNSAGQVDDTVAKPWGPFVGPMVMLFVAALFLALPRLSPRGFEIEEKARAYRAIVVTVMLFLFALHCVAIALALGVPLRINIVTPVLLGLLLAVLGNYLSKVPRNFFIGVRTPWTLADEDVWFRTHRLASRVFVATGLLIAIAAPFAGGRYSMPIVLTAVIAAAAITVIYSYAIYKRLPADQNNAGS